jgi:hypothetical protein
MTVPTAISREQRAGERARNEKRQLRKNSTAPHSGYCSENRKSKTRYCLRPELRPEGSEVEVSEIENGVSGSLTAKDNIDACEN